MFLSVLTLFRFGKPRNCFEETRCTTARKCQGSRPYHPRYRSFSAPNPAATHSKPADLIIGTLLVVAGLTFFVQGLNMGLFPLGETMANEFARKASLPWLFAFALRLGVWHHHRGARAHRRCRGSRRSCRRRRGRATKRGSHGGLRVWDYGLPSPLPWGSPSCSACIESCAAGQFSTLFSAVTVQWSS